jgi:RNA polymerase sigma-70 factor (ECF subfamily)
MDDASSTDRPGCEPRPPQPPLGDDRQEQLVQWLTRSQGWLYGHILTLLPDGEAAKDVLQQVNLVLWRKRAEFDPALSFLGWAARIAHFQVLAHFRDRGRERLLLGDDILESLTSDSIAEAPQCDYRSDVAALRSCLEKLGERDRALILERYRPGISVQAMATQLGKSVNAVSRSLYRIRGLLSTCIERVLPLERE